MSKKIPKPIPPKPADELHGIDDQEIHKDLRIGAVDISSCVFGTPEKARAVYHLAETSRLPIFTFGNKLAIRKSVLRAYFWAKERRAFRSQEEEQLVRLAMLLLKLSALIREGNAYPASPGDIHLWMTLLTEASRAIDGILRSE